LILKMNENRLLIKSSETFVSKLDYVGIIGLLSILLFVPLIFYKNEFIWIKIFAVYLILWPIMISYFLKSMFKRGIDFFYTPVLVPVILLDIVAGFSVFHAYNYYLSLQVLVKQIAYQIPFFLFIYYARNIKFRTVAVAVTVVSIIASIYGIAQFFNIISPPIDPWGRPNPASTMGLTNFTTDYFVMVIPLILTAFLTAQKNKYIQYSTYIGLLLAIAYIIIGKNRAGWIALLSSLPLYVVLFNKYKRDLHLTSDTRHLLFYTGIAIIFAIIMAIGFTKTGTELVQRGESIFNLHYPSNAFRILVWESTIKGIKDNPVFGIGLGNYPINIPLYEVDALKTIDWQDLRYLNNAHNEYLQIMFELGIIGFLCFLWFIIEIFVAGIKSIQDAEDSMQGLWNIALITGIVAALVSALFTFNLENPASAIMFWSFAGLIIGKRRYKHFEDEYGFTSALKKLSRFKWRWKYDFELSMVNNTTLMFVFVTMFIISVIILGNLTSFAYNQAMANIYNTEAETYLDLKMPKKAMDVITRAYSLAPHDYMILYTLARAEAGSFNTADAILDAKKIISLAPYFSYGHKLLGFLYYNKDNYVGAINEFNTSIELMPLSITEIGPYLISSYLGTNDFDKAISLALSLLKDEPQNQIYNFLLGTAYYMKGDYNSAVIYLKEAAKKDPSDFKILLNLTESLEKVNRYEDAQKYAVQLTTVAPEDPVSWYTLARIDVLLHNESGVFQALEKLFKINPSYKMVVVNDSTFSKLLGKPKMKELLTGKVFVIPHEKSKRHKPISHH